MLSMHNLELKKLFFLLLNKNDVFSSKLIEILAQGNFKEKHI